MISQNVIDERLFDIFVSKKLLGQFEVEIRKIIDLCLNEKEFDIVIHALSEITILDHSQLSFALKLMARHITDRCQQHPKVAVVAMAYGSGADGSQLVLQMLKTELKRGLNVELFNTISSYLRKMPQYPNFVLVDDFSGTGSTVLNRIDHIRKDAHSRNISITGSVCLIAAMENAKRKIEEDGVELKLFKELKAGISGYFSGDELTNAIARMRRLETELNPIIDGKPLPSLGHGQAEALYFVHPGNAPNSNFPIFWWPEDKLGNERKTLIRRYEL